MGFSEDGICDAVEMTERSSTGTHQHRADGLEISTGVVNGLGLVFIRLLEKCRYKAFKGNVKGSQPRLRHNIQAHLERSKGVRTHGAQSQDTLAPIDGRWGRHNGHFPGNQRSRSRHGSLFPRLISITIVAIIGLTPVPRGGRDGRSCLFHGEEITNILMYIPPSSPPPSSSSSLLLFHLPYETPPSNLSA
ncbi:uncharacterized protein K489DRAFT_178900 [Dissoconium aciculare CBS 342.82]|uniref:Uncharacterized protein n=1 Tax=Dissoconium aciculare CBS 342.82 TaxID=1314786 RepID=A0A6J3M9I1_9PEZI|nr:uncharacterized protein K489DRAFT_178900 [Dissoconium aciculare CBS 342.82]KAF1824279.1 hypothetical protein K489DRAFT_178900 [Dissoconium aciculare CBS 342.82]